MIALLTLMLVVSACVAFALLNAWLWRKFFRSTRFGSSTPTNGVFTPGSATRPTEFQPQPSAPVFRRN
jgi:hypothetical protein